MDLSRSVPTLIDRLTGTTPATSTHDQSPSFRVYIDLTSFQQANHVTAVLDYRQLVPTWEYKLDQANKQIHAGERIDMVGGGKTGDSDMIIDVVNDGQSDSVSSDDSYDSVSESVMSDVGDIDVGDVVAGRRRRVNDDYDATDPFIDDSGIAGGESELEVLSGSDDDNVIDKLAGFIATQREVNVSETSKRSREDKLKQLDEKYQQKQEKQLAKQAKRFDYPPVISSLFDRIKQQAISDNVHTSSRRPDNVSTGDITSIKQRSKRLSEAMTSLLVECEQHVQSIVASKDHRLVYTRLTRFLPDWTSKALKNKMRADKKKVRTQAEIDAMRLNVTQRMSDLQHAVKCDCDRYVELVSTTPKKSTDNVKLRHSDDGTQNTYTYNARWQLFTELMHRAVLAQNVLSRRVEGSRAGKDRLDSKALMSKIDDDRRDLLKRMCKMWPASLDVTFKQLQSNYTSFIKRQQQSTQPLTSAPHTSTPSPVSSTSPTTALQTSVAVSPKHSSPRVKSSPSIPAITAPAAPLVRVPPSAQVEVLVSSATGELSKHDNKRKQSELYSTSSSAVAPPPATIAAQTVANADVSERTAKKSKPLSSLSLASQPAPPSHTVPSLSTAIT